MIICINNGTFERITHLLSDKDTDRNEISFTIVQSSNSPPPLSVQSSFISTNHKKTSNNTNNNNNTKHTRLQTRSIVSQVRNTTRIRRTNINRRK